MIFSPSNWKLSEQFIYFVGNRLTPLIRCLFTRHFNCQMRKSFIRCCSMPVLHLCRNIDAVARFHLDGLFTLLLIITAAGHTDQVLLGITIQCNGNYHDIEQIPSAVV